MSRSKAWLVVLVVALVALVGSLGSLGAIGLSYLQGQWRYAGVADAAGFEAADLDGGGLSRVSVDWAALEEANPDTVAWLYVPGTKVNYPVVKGSDNEYYLTHDFDGEAGWLANYGAVFMDCRNSADLSDEATFFYGHHMNDGSMFSDLAELAQQPRFDECRAMYLLAPSGNYKLRTFSMVHCGADEELVQTGFESDSDRAAYVQDKIDRSVVDPGALPPASSIGSVLAFATCDNLSTDGRYVLYSYIEDAAAEGLAGTLGIAVDGGMPSGFANDLKLE